jgi:ribose 5-phosphate isomerase B
MRIVLAADHAAVSEKAAVAEALRDAGHEVQDLGPFDDTSVDYPDFAAPAARAVASGEADRAVLLCGTGIGQSIAANKVHGARAAVVSSAAAAEMSRRHNNANVACFGARLQEMDEILGLLHLWLETPFDGGRHERRVSKIDALDAPAS